MVRFRHIAALLLVACAPAFAQTQSLDAIRVAAIDALGGSGQNAQAMLDPALRLAACAQPLQATASGPKTALVRCDDTPGWRIYVPVRMTREAEVVVLAAPVAAGTPITPQHLIVQRRDIDALSGATFTDPAALVGRVPNHALAVGRVPTESDFTQGSTLRRGDPVVLLARTGGIEVRMEGRALGPAQAGGRIAVENTSSHRVLRGRVVGDGVVEVVP